MLFVNDFSSFETSLCAQLTRDGVRSGAVSGVVGEGKMNRQRDAIEYSLNM
jgi:hypothetical protein